MNLRYLLTVASVGVMVSGALAQEPVAVIAQKNGWQTDLNAARALARRDNKPLFLVFRCQP